MQAYRTIQDVSDDGFVKIKVPSGMGQRVEIILLPSEKDGEKTVDGSLTAGMHSQNGFCLQVLAAEEEDVWNDL
ncbi:MAG: hypothetical protein PHD82_15165 [Candidatus Riflebacteria bacterium]|nr:hypothetical protein [Candidatus Riflebacteria bacterium]